MLAFLLFWSIAYVLGVILIYLDKEQLGTCLMLLNPIGLIPFICLSAQIGIKKSAIAYITSLFDKY